MNFKDFVSGRWIQQYQYKSFSPVPVNHEWTWNDPQINTLLEEAMRAIGELNAFSLIIPDVGIWHSREEKRFSPSTNLFLNVGHERKFPIQK